MEVGQEFGWAVDVEVEAEHADVDGDDFEGIGAGDEDASVVVDGFDDAYGGVDAGQDFLGGGVRSGVAIMASERTPAGVLPWGGQRTPCLHG